MTGNDPNLAPGVKQSDLDGPELSEDELEQRRIDKADDDYDREKSDPQ